MLGKINLPSFLQTYIPRSVESVPADAPLLHKSPIYLEWPEALALRATIDYRVFGQRVGALYLGKSKGAEPTMVFGFDVTGTHIYDLARQIEGFYDPWRSGLQQSFPKHISWKIHVGYRESSLRKSQDLTQLAMDADNPVMVQMICDRLAQVQALTREHQRCHRFVHLYCYYWGRRDYSKGKTSDHFEMALKDLFSVGAWIRTQISGQKEQAQLRRVEETFATAFYQGFQSTADHLKSTLGLVCRPMGHDELWGNLRARFSGDEAGASPYTITCEISESGIQLSEDMDPNVHICNVLARDGAIQLDGQGVSIQRWNRERQCYEHDHIGVLMATQKFTGWKHGYHQLSSLHTPLTLAEVHGIEYFIELSFSNAKLQARNAQERHRQAKARFERAAQRGDYSAAAKRELEESQTALEAFDENERALRVAFVALVHRRSANELDLACRSFQNHFKVAELEREFTAAGRIWLQTLPVMDEHLAQLHIPVMGFGNPMPSIDINHRYVYSSGQALGFLPFARTLVNDRTGIEFIATDKQPVNVDLFSHHKTPHWCAVAEQRKGKSVVAQAISDRAISLGQPVTWVDIPPQDDSSSLKDRCELLGGSHVDIYRESFNLLGIPAALLLEDSSLTPEQQKDRFKLLQAGWIELLMILGGPTQTEQHLNQVTREILRLAIELYLKDHSIQSRYAQAVKAGFGTPEWHQMPTLEQFATFLKPHRLQEKMRVIDGTTKQALELLELRLAQKCDPTTPLGAAIARSSTVNVEQNLLTVFSLRGIQLGTEESLCYASAAYATAIQKSLSHPISHLIFEEAHRAADDPGVLQMMSDAVTLYGKAGVRVGLVTNSFGSVARTKAGQALIDNLSLKFIGKIQAGSAQQLSQLLQIPIELICKCSSNNFVPDLKSGSSQWLVQDSGRHYLSTFYPGWMSLALSASNSHQRAVRQTFLTHTQDRSEALSAFTCYFRTYAERAQSMPMPSREIIERAQEKCQIV